MSGTPPGLCPRAGRSPPSRRRPLLGPGAALLAGLLGACAQRSGAEALPKRHSWAQGVIDPTHFRAAAIGPSLRDPKEDVLCSDFGDWLEKNKIGLFSCELTRLVPAGSGSTGVPMYEFSGLLQPYWWATDAAAVRRGRQLPAP